MRTQLPLLLLLLAGPARAAPDVAPVSSLAWGEDDVVDVVDGSLRVDVSAVRADELLQRVSRALRRGYAVSPDLAWRPVTLSVHDAEDVPPSARFALEAITRALDAEWRRPGGVDTLVPLRRVTLHRRGADVVRLIEEIVGAAPGRLEVILREGVRPTVDVDVDGVSYRDALALVSAAAGSSGLEGSYSMPDRLYLPRELPPARVIEVTPRGVHLRIEKDLWAAGMEAEVVLPDEAGLAAQLRPVLEGATPGERLLGVMWFRAADGRCCLLAGRREPTAASPSPSSSSPGR